MPVNAGIYAQYAPAPTRLATLGELAQARDQREVTRQNREITDLNLESKRREFAEKDRTLKVQEQLRGIIARNMTPDGPNQKAILREAYTVDPDAAGDLEKHFSEIQKAATTQRSAELEGEGKQLSYVANALKGVDNDETYQLVLPMLKAYDQKYGDTVSQQLGPTFDPVRVKAAVNAGLSQAEYRQKQVDVLNSEEKNVTKALNLFSLAQDEAGWQDAQQFAKLHAVDDDVAAMGLRGPFSPDMVAKAGALTQTPQQRATLAKEAAAPQGSDYGRFEADYLEAEAAKLGKTVAQLNPQQRVQMKTAARKAFGQADDAAYRGLAPIVIQTAQGPQLLDRTTRTVSPIADAAGQTVGLAPTAAMREKAAGRELVGKSINAIKTLSDKIITRVGPSQRADAIKRGVDTVFGNDPAFRTYQDARMALAGNLAVGQQGSRPSDADIKAIWLPLVPDPYRDTKESADLKWQLINTMSNNQPAASATTGKTVTETQLKNIANMRKTDIETERKRAADAGYQVVP